MDRGRELTVGDHAAGADGADHVPAGRPAIGEQHAIDHRGHLLIGSTRGQLV